MMIDVLVGLVIVAVLVLYLIYGKPYTQKYNYYKEVKLALLIMEKSFKQLKLIEIADICMTIVQEVEKLDMASAEKQAQAVQMASVEIMEKLGLEMDEDLLSLVIDVAVSHMPENQK